MSQPTYIYAMIGNQDDATVLRYLTDIDTPLPGGDVATTPAVGPLVVESVQQDEAGRTVILAYDPAPTDNEVAAALNEGWQQPPGDDPWAALAPGAVARVHPQ